MATVTTKTGAVTFVLELDEAEAQYVEAALRTSNCNNSPDGGDPTWTRSWRPCGPTARPPTPAPPASR